MPEDPISAALKEFIAQHVHSVEQLEILCLLGGRPQESLPVSAIFRKIQSNEESIAGRLRLFVSGQLVTADPDAGYRLSPIYQPVVADLAKAYRERPVTVIELIYLRPKSPLEAFSDAFRFKKKE